MNVGNLLRILHPIKYQERALARVSEIMRVKMSSSTPTNRWPNLPNKNHVYQGSERCQPTRAIWAAWLYIYVCVQIIGH